MNGKEIKATRKLFNLTQKDFADIFGYKARQWISFEQNKATPPEGIIIRLYQMRQQVEPSFLQNIFSKMDKLENEIKELKGKQKLATLNSKLDLQRLEVRLTKKIEKISTSKTA